MSETETFDYILDSFALLAHFDGEPGAGRVKEVLDFAAQGECRVGMSIINVGEVADIVERERGLPRVHEVLAILRALPVAVLDADEAAVFSAAHIKAHSRISYADAFAAAAAQKSGGTLLTGDREFAAVEGSLIRVEWLPV